MHYGCYPSKGGVSNLDRKLGGSITNAAARFMAGARSRRCPSTHNLHTDRMAWIQGTGGEYAYVSLRRQPVNEYRLAAVYGLAAGLHTVVDPLVTVGLTRYPHAAEGNPFMRSLLHSGLDTFLLAHIPLWGITIGCFAGLLYCIRQTKDRWRPYLVRAFWLISLATIVWGAALVGNNLYIFLTGQSLI